MQEPHKTNSQLDVQQNNTHNVRSYQGYFLQLKEQSKKIYCYSIQHEEIENVIKVENKLKFIYCIVNKCYKIN